MKNKRSNAVEIAYGKVESSGLHWCIAGSEKANNADLRAIAALLLAAADRLDKDPTALDRRLTA